MTGISLPRIAELRSDAEAQLFSSCRATTAFRHGRDHDRHHRDPFPCRTKQLLESIQTHHLNQFHIYENQNRFLNTHSRMGASWSMPRSGDPRMQGMQT
jgi:hypothetical protein